MCEKSITHSDQTKQPVWPFSSALDENMKIIYFLLISPLLIVSSPINAVVCKVYGESAYTKALILKLNTEGMKFSQKNGINICASKQNIEQIKLIAKEVDQYYRSVATILTTKKSKEAVLSWVAKENKPHYKKIKENGLFIVLYSLTEEESIENKIKLNELTYN